MFHKAWGYGMRDLRSLRVRHPAGWYHSASSSWAMFETYECAMICQRVVNHLHICCSPCIGGTRRAWYRQRIREMCCFEYERYTEEPYKCLMVISKFRWGRQEDRVNTIAKILVMFVHTLTEQHRHLWTHIKLRKQRYEDEDEEKVDRPSFDASFGEYYFLVQH